MESGRDRILGLALGLLLGAVELTMRSRFHVANRVGIDIGYVPIATALALAL